MSEEDGPARTRRRDDAGSVVLETALMTPVLALLLAGVVGLVSVLTDQLAAERAARAIARSVAVSGSPGAAAAGLAADARVTVERRGEQVAVTVVIPGRVARVPYEARALSGAVVERTGG